MKETIKRYWRAIARPSRHYSLGFLALGGFVMGIIFWGGFNTAMEFTNSEMFCTSCHQNLYEELQSCADGDRPRQWCHGLRRPAGR